MNLVVVVEKASPARLSGVAIKLIDSHSDQLGVSELRETTINAFLVFKEGCHDLWVVGHTQLRKSLGVSYS